MKLVNRQGKDLLEVMTEHGFYVEEMNLKTAPTMHAAVYVTFKVAAPNLRISLEGDTEDS